MYFSSYYFRFSSLQFSPQFCCSSLCSAHFFSPQLSTKFPQNMGSLFTSMERMDLGTGDYVIEMYKDLFRIGPFCLCLRPTLNITLFLMIRERKCKDLFTKVAYLVYFHSTKYWPSHLLTTPSFTKLAKLLSFFTACLLS